MGFRVVKICSLYEFMGDEVVGYVFCLIFWNLDVIFVEVRFCFNRYGWGFFNLVKGF